MTIYWAQNIFTLKINEIFALAPKIMREITRHNLDMLIISHYLRVLSLISYKNWVQKEKCPFKAHLPCSKKNKFKSTSLHCHGQETLTSQNLVGT